MRKRFIILPLAFAFGLYLAQVDSATGTAALPVEEAESSIRPVEVNMHDFMEGVFQGPYRRLKEAMAKEPGDNAGWKQLRGDALILAEGGNLLLTRAPEDGAPEDGASDWKRFSVESRNAGEKVFLAAKKKDFAAAREAYVQMLEHCNACHRQFEKGRHILTP